METYEKGGHMYHATMPTDGLVTFWKTIKEMQSYGIDRIKVRSSSSSSSGGGVKGL